MDEDREPLYEEEEILEVVRRYEDMKKNRSTCFFDVYEFESIIDYYIESKNSKYALEAATLASRQHPTSLIIQLKKAQVLVDKGEPLQSLQILERLEMLESTNYEIFSMKGTALILMGDIEGARKNFDHALSLDPENQEELLFEIAQAFEQLGHFREALRYLRRALLIAPRNISLLYEMAFCFNKLNDLDKSIHFYRKYLNIDPFADNIWYNLGIVYNKRGDFQKAIEAYDYALAINDQNAFAYFNKGNILANLENYPEAIAAYTDYLAIEEDSTEALTYIADCYEGMGNYQKASTYFRKALEIDPEFPEPWYGVGKVLLAMGYPDDSLSYLKKAIALDREDPDYWIALAVALRETGDTGEAETAMMEALKLDPFDYQTWLDLAELLIGRKEYHKALSVLIKADENLPGKADIIYRISACYFLIQDEEKAMQNLNRGLKINLHKYTDLFIWFPQGKDNRKIRHLIHHYKNQ